MHTTVSRPHFSGVHYYLPFDNDDVKSVIAGDKLENCLSSACL